MYLTLFLTNEFHINYCKSNNYLLKSHLATWMSDSPPYFQYLQTGDRIWTKTRIGDGSSSEPMQWELSPSGQLGFNNLNQAVEFRQLLLSLARKSAGISISLGAVLWEHFCKGEATVGIFKCADLRFWKAKLFSSKAGFNKHIQPIQLVVVQYYEFSWSSPTRQRI